MSPTEYQKQKMEMQEAEVAWREFEGKAVQRPKYEGTAYKKSSSGQTVGGKEIKYYSLEEVAQHNVRGDCWIAVEGKVYDVTKYLSSHPGGSMPILAMGGRDATDPFHNYHPAPVYKQLKYYYIGEVLLNEKEERSAASDFVREHRQLRQKFLEQGLFETNYLYYVGMISWYLLLLGTGIYLTVTGDSTLVRFVGAFFFAAFFQQVAFLGHDLGHNGVSHVREIDSAMGVIFGPLLSGISMAWWKHTHNIHHVACNSVDLDNDIQHMPMLAVTTAIADWWRKKEMPNKHLDSFARWMVSNQSKTFYPIMFLVARYNLYGQSLGLLLTWPEKIPKRAYEIASMFTFFAWLSYVVSFNPTVWEKVLWMIISHGAAGILHIQIVLSHFSMPTYRGQAYNDISTDEWFRMQVRTSLNVDCPQYLDWFHGGLQFQVEHHLWPRIPRHNLRHVQKECEAFCKKHNVEYTKLTWFKAIDHMKTHLNKVGEEFKSLPPGAAGRGFFDSMIWEAACAKG